MSGELQWEGLYGCMGSCSPMERLTEWQLWRKPRSFSNSRDYGLMCYDICSKYVEGNAASVSQIFMKVQYRVMSDPVIAVIQVKDRTWKHYGCLLSHRDVPWQARSTAAPDLPQPRALGPTKPLSKHNPTAKQPPPKPINCVETSADLMLQNICTSLIIFFS